jgi:hypothetical protein
MLCISCNLAVLGIVFCLQQTIEGVQANTLRAAAHLPLQGSEAVHAPKCADDVAECTLANLALDGQVIVNNVREDGSEAKLHQRFGDPHLLAVSVLQLECVLHV